MAIDEKVEMIQSFYGYIHALTNKGSNECSCGGCLLLFTSKRITIQMIIIKFSTTGDCLEGMEK